jgi:hypothetical protein
MKSNENKTAKQRLFMIEYLTGAVANKISENEKIGLIEAFGKFFNSIWYKRLLNYDTLLYRESAGYVYELYKSNHDELL